jgi:hypothetical protein
MLPDFKNITYLNNGSPLQQKAYDFLVQSKILYQLQPFNPILAGTLPLDIFIEGKSDLDILCEANSLQSVEKLLLTHFKNETGFLIRSMEIRSVKTLICNFIAGEFPIEIFCQSVATINQLAYRHLIIEYLLLAQYGEQLKNEVIKLKNQGIKTEPAFALVLGLSGDPYEALLKYENLLL